jgi:hypothetical protein
LELCLGDFGFFDDVRGIKTQDQGYTFVLLTLAPNLATLSRHRRLAEQIGVCPGSEGATASEALRHQNRKIIDALENGELVPPTEEDRAQQDQLCWDVKCAESFRY